MKIPKAYKTRLDPNNTQVTRMKMNCGAARYAYNYALNKKKAALEEKGKIPNAMDIHKQLTKIKGTEELNWAYAKGISKCSFQEAIRDCDKAFQNFFRKSEDGQRSSGFPKFKSKRNDKQSFRLYGVIKVLDGYIQLPSLGKIKLFERDYLPKDSRILSATVSKRADKWFVSLQVEEEHYVKSSGKGVVGVDLGVKTLAVCSDGTSYESPKALKSNLKKLKRYQRKLSRRVDGSKNRGKIRSILGNLHYRISNIRKDNLHKVTSKIINDNQVIVLEDLKISNMLKNHSLAQAISDVGMYEFRRQIEYKSIWNNRLLVYVDQFFPSSKLCSSCGHKKQELRLDERTYSCSNCGLHMDRDLNAAKNLEQFYTGSSSGIYAFGDGSSVRPEMSEHSPSLN